MLPVRKSTQITAPRATDRVETLPAVSALAAVVSKKAQSETAATLESRIAALEAWQQQTVEFLLSQGIEVPQP